MSVMRVFGPHAVSLAVRWLSTSMVPSMRPPLAVWQPENTMVAPLRISVTSAAVQAGADIRGVTVTCPGQTASPRASARTMSPITRRAPVAPAPPVPPVPPVPFPYWANE